ncbi:MAG TPA: PKD domain-containing protein [Gemmatimonadaceae bacterium]|nr:PKD domain-containing protein [Gemmatimonadaceae bacterium]
MLLTNVACSGGAESPSAPTSTLTPTTTVTASTTVGVQAATSVRFSAQAANFEAGALSYRWEFGDGETSTDAAPAHIYSSPGTHTVVVTVTNSRQSARAETSLTIYSVTGTWLSIGDTTTMYLTQSGSAITGEASEKNGPGEAPYSQCAISGYVEVGTPAVIFLTQPPCSHPRFAPLAPLDYRLNMTTDGQRLVGLATEDGRTFQIALRR